MPYNDFSFLTDSEDEKTVDDIISQATDHLVLEQIAKLNSSDTLLPSNLETRFRKLKSTTRAANSTSRALVKSKSFTPSLGNESADEEKGKGMKKSKDDENFLSKVLESKVRKFKELETKVKTRTRTSLSGSSMSESDSEKSDSDKTKRAKSKGKASSNSNLSKPNNSNSSPSDESDLDSETDKKKSKQKNLKSKSFRTENVSDMWRKIGCLFCSPKKKGKKQGNGKENRLSFSSLGDYDDDEEDYLKSFSAKEQNKLMKKAMKEEEQLNKEAEKIVKWAKQASDRMMNVSGLNLDEDLSDFDK